MDPEPGSLDAILQGKQAGERQMAIVDEETIDILVFQIEQEWYAFAGASIREILSQTEIFYVPGCIASMEGVINVRGNIETVINLSDTLGPRSADYPPGWVILLGRTAALQSGIRVDKVIDVLTISKSSIQPAPASLPEKLQAAVSGIVEYRGAAMALLNLERIFDDYGRRLG